jgi:hypothetical protein
MRRPIAVLIFVATLAGSGAAVAAPGPLTVGVNQNQYVDLHGSAAKVVVGDASIADVAMSDAHSLTLIGRSLGVTRVRVTDKRGRALLDSEIQVIPANDGRVTLFRGVERSDFSCAGGRCRPLAAQSAATPGGGQDESGTAPVNSAPMPAGGVQPVQPSPAL